MLLAILIVASLTLLAVLVDLFVDLRSIQPRKKSQLLKDAALGAVRAAEERYPGKNMGQDKARYARQSLLDAAALQRIKITPARADALVHQALAEVAEK